MTYQEAIQFLYDLRMFGAKLGLDNVRKLAARVGNPQERLSFIHVAGTNGKGSTCAFLESVYRTAGHRTGLFSSPHLVSFRERIQVDKRLIPEASVIDLVRELKPVLEGFPQDSHPTFFEVITVMAMMHFEREACEIVILETGLGGRLDATNIVTPIASVITNVDLDHQAWLGDTIEAIAFEKAGIIKPSIPVVTSAQNPSVLEVIREKAASEKAPLHEITSDEVDQWKNELSSLPLPGEHQWWNAALAAATATRLHKTITAPSDRIRVGLQGAQIRGRFEVVERAGQTLILDCAHNPAGIRSFVDTFQEEFPNRDIALIIGMLGDKETAAMCASLATIARKICVIGVQSSRLANPEELRDLLLANDRTLHVEVLPDINSALKGLEEEGHIGITGSIHFLGEAYSTLGMEEGQDERGLNEYGNRTGK